MSSTRNVQNLITTVFRPVYYYDLTAKAFIPHVEMSNVDTYIGNEVRVFRAQVGDSTNNMYVGIGSGNSYSNTTSGNSNLTAVGVSAGSSTNNVSNSVYVGGAAGSGQSSVSNVIAIGVSALGGGSNNIFIGNSTGNGSSNNIFIGHNIAPASTVSNTLNIHNVLYGDFSNHSIGIGTSNRAYGDLTNLDVSGGVYVSGKMGIQMQPSNSLNVNGATQTTGGVYSFSGSNLVQPLGTVNIGTISSGAFASPYGNILVSAQDITTAGANYDSGMFYCSTISQNAIRLTTNIQNGDVTIAPNYANIAIGNSNETTARTIYWSITYFPLTP
jgi:hypothetical protein